MDFDQLYKEQFPVVYRYLTGLCGNQALAEELAQETFCRAIEHSASFRQTNNIIERVKYLLLYHPVSASVVFRAAA